MKNQHNIKLWTAAIVGLALGWLAVHMVVINWDRITAFVM